MTGLLVTALVLPLCAPAACFDFSKKIERALLPPAPLRPAVEGALSEASGELPSGGVWAAVRGRVASSVEALVTDLQTQRARKGNGEMRISLWQDPTFLTREKVTFTVKPLPFVAIEWTEDWAASLLEGSAAQPERVLVAYEKTAGTSYIAHLCGDIVLTRLAAGGTDVLMYDEIKATRRSEADTLNGIRATLRTLQVSPP